MALSEAELRKWRGSFADEETVAVLIDKQMLDMNECIDKKQQCKFSKTLACLALCKDDVEAFIDKHNGLYRWCWCHNTPMRADREARPVLEYVESMLNDLRGNVDHKNKLLSEGWKWMLQLKVKDNWLDWVYIKRSQLAHANLGVFTARDFPRGSIIGFHVGPTVYQSEIEGGARPSDEELDKVLTDDSSNSITLRDMNGCWRTIDAPAVDQNIQDSTRPDIPKSDGEAAAVKRDGASLYMGMHYINSACLMYEKDTPPFEKARKQQNCIISENGFVQTVKKIGKNIELFNGYSDEERYNFDDEAPMKTSGACGNKATGTKRKKEGDDGGKTTGNQSKRASKKDETK